MCTFIVSSSNNSKPLISVLTPLARCWPFRSPALVNFRHILLTWMLISFLPTCHIFYLVVLGFTLFFAGREGVSFFLPSFFFLAFAVTFHRVWSQLATTPSQKSERNWLGAVLTCRRRFNLTETCRWSVNTIHRAA